MSRSGEEELEARIGHGFQDSELLRRALTHKSRAFEASAAGGEPGENNEQLEFLGDAVLGLLVSEMLVRHFPELSEGLLSKAKARLVSADHLYETALGIGLGQYLLLGRGEEMNGGRKKRALLANSLEALIAAIYLDGGAAAARKFVMEVVVGDLEEFAAQRVAVIDFKGALQEFAQSRGFAAPRYRVVASSGPEHSKRFTVEVTAGEELSARAEGTSKKTAGQRAAELLLETLEREYAEA